MTTMETSELTGAQLDYWVAKAEGLDPTVDAQPKYMPSTEWAQGGAIIEREKIMVAWSEDHWIAGVTAHVENKGGVIYKGPTALVAAMRAYVAAKLGTEIQNG
jgi:hypothetical protein